MKAPGNLTYETNEDGCWICTSHACISSGYPQVKVYGRDMLAHRYVYTLTHGPIAPGDVIRHTCDNKRCINPDHLVAGTHADNVRDAIERGRRRYVSGRENGKTKLSDDDVVYIREHADEGIVRLARLFDVSTQLVSHIQTGRARRNLPGPIRQARKYTK